MLGIWNDKSFYGLLPNLTVSIRSLLQNAELSSIAASPIYGIEHLFSRKRSRNSADPLAPCSFVQRPSGAENKILLIKINDEVPRNARTRFLSPVLLLTLECDKASEVYSPA